jgi:oxygen-independent coproporphyrinogen-3 oxidase
MHPGDGLTQLYIGGGTPTAVPAPLLDRLLESIFSHTTPSGSHIHTCESSPETISEAHLDVLRSHCIGRVSMGVQSLEDTVLDTVHREQTESGVLDACELLLGSGLIVNLDLIYGLPGQRHESFVRDLTTLADLGVPSFTVYSLRTSERTPVSRVLGDERFDLASLMEWRALVQHTAEDLGYTQTRWHTFKRLDTSAGEYERLACFDESLTGHQLGIGMSARSHLGYTVFRNHSVHDPYLERIEAHESPVEEVFELDEADRITQFIARSIGDGLHLSRPVYERTFGRPIEDDFGEVLARLGDADLVGEDGDNLVLTERGKLVYDLITLSFYPPRARAWLAGLDDRAAFVTIGSPATVDG